MWKRAWINWDNRHIKGESLLLPNLQLGSDSHTHNLHRI